MGRVPGSPTIVELGSHLPSFFQKNQICFDSENAFSARGNVDHGHLVHSNLYGTLVGVDPSCDQRTSETEISPVSTQPCQVSDEPTRVKLPVTIKSDVWTMADFSTAKAESALKSAKEAAIARTERANGTELPSPCHR